MKQQPRPSESGLKNLPIIDLNRKTHRLRSGLLFLTLRVAVFNAHRAAVFNVHFLSGTQ
jgi:hypothetical protein